MAQTVNSMIVRDKRFDVFTANKRDGELWHLFRAPSDEKHPSF